MSADDAVFTSLLDMGIDPPLARAAAVRFTHADAAVNWCFGAGMNWTPEQDTPVPKVNRPVPPTPDFAKPGTTVEHHEVVSKSDAGNKTPPMTQSPVLPALPARPGRSANNVPSEPTVGPQTQAQPSSSTIEFGDKNPFRSSVSASSTNPFHDPKPAEKASEIDEDEELQKALAMSVEPSMEVDPPSYDDGRDERERSVRATAPPPSPTEKRAVMDAFRGYVERDEEIPGLEGHMGSDKEIENEFKLIPYQAVPGPINQAPTRTKEEEDMEKAIADSLMTASFHSSSSVPRNINEPEQVPRRDEAPMVLYSETGQATSTANFLQAVMSVPRIREMIATMQEVDDKQSVIRLLWKIIKHETFTTDSFMGIDEIAKFIYGDGQNKISNYGLPPLPRMRATWERMMIDTLDDYDQASPSLRAEWERKQLPGPYQLFHSLAAHSTMTPSYVNLWRNAEVNDIHSGMRNTLWKNDTLESLHEISDIFAVLIGREPDARREVWKLEERVVIDRYMTKNLAWACQIRAAAGVAEGKVRRLKEKIDRLTTFEGNSIETSIKSVLKHYESTPGTDEMNKEQRRDMKEKLEKTLAQIQAKVEELRTELKAGKKAADGGLFDTDDPKYNQHVYRLRSVLYHDGGLMGPGHLYMYLLGTGDQWWKIQDHEATPVDFSVVASDSTGLYMDGGPYALIYDRESPRLEPYGSFTEGYREATKSKTEEADQGTPRAPGRTDTTGVTLYASEDVGEAQHIEHRVSSTTDLLGDELPKSSPRPGHTPRPLPAVPTQPAPAPETQVETAPKEENEDITMS